MNNRWPCSAVIFALLLISLRTPAQDGASEGRDAAAVSVARYLADVAWLADDARGGRGLGTPGLAASADWLEEQFAGIGLEPAAGDGGFRQSFRAVASVERGSSTRLTVAGDDVSDGDFVVPGFSASTAISVPVVFAGWGLVSEEHGIDDYADVDAEGRIVLVRRFAPQDGAFEDDTLRRRLSDLRYKAFTARERGAVGLLVADLPVDGNEQEEAPLPAMRADPQGGAGIAVAVIKRAWAERILESPVEVSLTTEVVGHTHEVDNIVGRLAACGSPTWSRKSRWN